MKTQKEIAVFGGGCFWCGEAVFTRLRGVAKVTSGYVERAEVIRVEYNSNIITFEQLMSVFFSTHDPTTLNRQGSDVGTEYRSAIFYTTEEQRKEAEKFMKKLEEENPPSGGPIVTELKPLTNFYEAESYHQQYYENNKQAPYCQLVINPKIQKLQKQYSHLLK
ncbi:MAG: peptide-methionine (S)-S-oxide reductase MsrA [Patescibacteria group bacterium]